MEMVDTVKNLPREILERIFRMLFVQDLQNVVQVCRRWREVGETPALWSSLPIVVHPKNSGVLSEILGSRRLQSVTKIVFHCLPTMEDMWLIAKYPMVRDWAISHTKQLTLTSARKAALFKVALGANFLENLDVSLNVLSSLDASLLAGVVTRLQGIDLSHTDLNKHQLEAIMEGINKESKIKILNLSWNDLSVVESPLLSQAVPRLETLYVKKSYLCQDKAKIVLCCVGEGSQLTKLDISNNSLSSVDPEIVAKAVTCLNMLNIRKTFLTRTQKNAIFTSFGKYSKLRNLNLSWNNLSRVDSHLLARSVTKLETLNVRSTSLETEQIEAILTQVSEGCSLTNLNISWNNLGCVDPGLLARAVSRLETLVVKKSLLKPNQAEAILQIISEGSRLTYLDISDNNMSTMKAGLFAKAAVRLETLNVRTSSLGSRQIEEILVVVTEGSRLRNVDLSYNDASSVEIGLKIKATKRLQTLKINR